MLIAVVLYVLLALFDAWFTTKRLPVIGVEAELNPLARWAAFRFGIPIGIFFSVLIPTGLVLLLICHWLWAMTFMLGCRTTMFAFQLKVLFGRTN
jgi:hypothetical protein